MFLPDVERADGGESRTPEEDLKEVCLKASSWRNNSFISDNELCTVSDGAYSWNRNVPCSLVLIWSESYRVCESIHL